MDKNAKNQIAKRLKEATNVLVTVSSNPSVDQLSATIGLSLFLSKLKKHSTAVFSGDVPDTIGFLKPEETLEPTTDALQDFIIALDKSKADKIRYKVEDDLVKIFITPYRSSVGEEDLQFSMGDFNVDVVIALGVHNKDDLDQAISAHGRILHDATVATINTKDESELGSLNWTNKDASSLCEMVVSLTDLIKSNALDSQMATALLTGVVAETERFSNEKTTSVTMNASAKLMAAGANQQLVAAELEEEPVEPGIPPERQEEHEEEKAQPPPPKDRDEGENGALHISHEEKDQYAQPPVEPPKPEGPKPPEQEKQEHPKEPPKEEPEKQQDKSAQQTRIDPEVKTHDRGPGPMPPVAPPEEDEYGAPQIHRDEARRFLENPPSNQGTANSVIGGVASQNIPATRSDSRMITSPPSMGSKLSAMSDDFYGAEENDEGPLNLPQAQSAILDHNKKSEDKTKSETPQHSQSKPPNLDQAAEPEAQERPPSEPKDEEKPDQHPVKAPEPSEPSLEEKMRTKLPESFVRSLDEKTLKDIEKKTDSPHRSQVVEGMKDKTLDSIEETVQSPHLDIQAKQEEEQKEDDEEAKLDYEPHESEPPEKEGEQEQPESGQTGADSETKSPADSTDGNEQKSEDTEQSGKQSEENQNETDAARKAVLDAIDKGGDASASVPDLGNLGKKHVSETAPSEPSHRAKTIQPPADLAEASEDRSEAGEANKKSEGTPDSESEAAQASESQSQYTKPSSSIHIDSDGNLSYGEKPPATPPPLPPDPTAANSQNTSSAPEHQGGDGSSDDGKKPPSIPPPMMPPA